MSNNENYVDMLQNTNSYQHIIFDPIVDFLNRFRITNLFQQLDKVMYYC